MLIVIGICICIIIMALSCFVKWYLTERFFFPLFNKEQWELVCINSNTVLNCSLSVPSFFRHLTEVFAFQFSSATGDLSATENSFPQQNDGSLEAAIGYPFLKTQSSNLSDILKDSFKKTDSFTRWMSKELPEVEDSQIHSSSGGFWSTEEANNIIEASSREPLDQFTVSPMLSQDKLFSTPSVFV